jgi:hypothetical protein
MSCEGLKEDISRGGNEIPKEGSAIVTFEKPHQPRKQSKKQAEAKKKLESMLTPLVFNGILAGFACEKA